MSHAEKCPVCFGRTHCPACDGEGWVEVSDEAKVSPAPWSYEETDATKYTIPYSSGSGHS